MKKKTMTENIWHTCLTESLNFYPTALFSDEPFVAIASAKSKEAHKSFYFFILVCATFAFALTLKILFS
ncbi:MAG: hypothetical protein HGB12_14745 [Bacteroidetes bacterium]|nr:hypothetical protein [Bacteroidota bacterium]